MKKPKTYKWESFKAKAALFVTKPYWKYITKKETDPIKKLEAFLKSIGGLKNGFYEGCPPITSRDFFMVGDGWIPLVHELIEKMIAAGWNKEVCQVKEKFAGMRFYINEASSTVHELIRLYETKSYEICEKCGKSGQMYRHGSWLVTRCTVCKVDGDVPAHIHKM